MLDKKKKQLRTAFKITIILWIISFFTFIFVYFSNFIDNDYSVIFSSVDKNDSINSYLIIFIFFIIFAVIAGTVFISLIILNLIVKFKKDKTVRIEIPSEEINHGSLNE